MTLIKPPRLREGDRIGVISPAGPVSKQELLPGLKFIESCGFSVYVAPHVYDVRDYLAGEDVDRLNALHSVIIDPEISAVFCARGGYGCMRILKNIDYSLIRKFPKILVGYSDVTALILAVYFKSGIVTYHGPMIREYIHGKEANLRNLLGFLSSKGGGSIHIEGEALRNGRAEGPLLGGNLSLICHLIGTSFLPQLDGSILFLEDNGEPPYRLDRMLTHLAISGLLENLAGLIFGDFEKCGEITEVHKLLKEFSSGFDFPVVRGLTVGHGPVNIPFPIGVRAALDTSDMTLSPLESWTIE
ncbi:LD-carboxypeptidase [Thermodesulfobacteriota bacterium]